jgi:hypothetical protein
MTNDKNLSCIEHEECFGGKCLFSAKPPREWQELTRGDILSWEMPAAASVVEFVWFVERKIRERNEPLLQRTWTGLTNDELTDLFHNENLGQMSAVGQAIELLRERNT